MKKKLLSLLSGSVLAVLVISGCDAGQDPPPEDNGVEDNGGGAVDENGDNGMNGNGNGGNDDGVMNGNGNGNGNGGNGEEDGIMDGEDGEGPLDEMEDEVEDPLDPNDEEENNNQ